MSQPNQSRQVRDESPVLSLRSDGASPGLRQIVRGIVAEAVRERRQRSLPPVAVEIDVALDHRIPVGGDSLRSGLLPLLRASCQAAALARGVGGTNPRLCEVVVTSVDTGSAIEIEVAHSGEESGHTLTAATVVALGKARALAEWCGGGVAVAACPEGGLAITLRIPHRRVRGLAA